MRVSNSGRNNLNLTRREFLGAGSGAAAATVLGSATGHAAWLSRTGSVGQPVDEVDPFIGTTIPGLRWMLFPGAAMPFGMVKLSPDNKAWSGIAGSGRAGYDYKIPTILGFSHIHSWTMSGLLMTPTTGPLKLVQGPEAGSPESFRSRFRHETESASPGYYAVTLDDYGVRCELSATTRAGIQRYTFPKTDSRSDQGSDQGSDQARILIALSVPGEYNTVVKNAVIRRVSDTEIEGESEQANSRIYTFQKYKLHFVIRFSKPFDSMGGWVGANVTHDTSEIAGHGDIGAFANYRTSEGEAITVKTGISYVSIEQARLNLDTEMGRFGWDFDAVHSHARHTWNELLSKIEVEGGSDTDRKKFYTNLYRSYVARSIFSDVNGKYVDPTGQIRQLKDPNSPMLGCDAFWNTFWNLNQLWGLVTPGILSQWVRSELQLNDDGGWLARGPAGLRYSGVMVGAHEIALIVSAWQKGIRDFDPEKAFAAIKHVQTTPESSTTTTSLPAGGSTGGSAWSSFQPIAISAMCRSKRKTPGPRSLSNMPTTTGALRSLPGPLANRAIIDTSPGVLRITATSGIRRSGIFVQNIVTAHSRRIFLPRKPKAFSRAQRGSTPSSFRMTCMA